MSWGTISLGAPHMIGLTPSSAYDQDVTSYDWDALCNTLLCLNPLKGFSQHLGGLILHNPL